MPNGPSDLALRTVSGSAGGGGTNANKNKTGARPNAKPIERKKNEMLTLVVRSVVARRFRAGLRTMARGNQADAITAAAENAKSTASKASRNRAFHEVCIPAEHKKPNVVQSVAFLDRHSALSALFFLENFKFQILRRSDCTVHTVH